MTVYRNSAELTGFRVTVVYSLREVSGSGKENSVFKWNSIIIF